jgi:hypothetical protein
VVSENLYGASQSSTYSISNGSRSVCPSSCGFDGNAASINGKLASNSTNNWTWTSFENTTLSTLFNATLEVNFYQSGWSNDRFVLEYTVDGWTTSQLLTTYNTSNPPPTTALTTASFTGLEDVIDTPAKADALQVRFRGLSTSGGADTITLRVDQVRLAVRGWP